jgi:hypothetical protein
MAHLEMRMHSYLATHHYLGISNMDKIRRSLKGDVELDEGQARPSVLQSPSIALR